MTDYERLYRLLVRGEYAAAGLEHPVSGPSVYRRIARTVLDTHGLDPLGDPEELARAEGLRVAWTPRIGSCGGSLPGGLVLVPWHRDLGIRTLLVTHERAHHALRIHGAPHVTEADALWMTLALGAFGGTVHPALPAWFARAAGRTAA